MSGVSYRVDTSELERLADDLVERISRPAPALRAVADLAEQTIQRNFTAGGRPTKWAPLKLRDGQPLRDTGRLMNSISAQPVGDRTVLVGTNVVYAAIHNSGGNPERTPRSEGITTSSVNALAMFACSPGTNAPIRGDYDALVGCVSAPLHMTRNERPDQRGLRLHRPVATTP